MTGSKALPVLYPIRAPTSCTPAWWSHPSFNTHNTSPSLAGAPLHDPHPNLQTNPCQVWRVGAHTRPPPVVSFEQRASAFTRPPPALRLVTRNRANRVALPNEQVHRPAPSTHTTTRHPKPCQLCSTARQATA